MRTFVLSTLLVLIALCGVAAAGEPAKPSDDLLSWPEVTSQSRPWTRWWWLGSAVSEAEITRQMHLFKQAGFGGVEVSPIYGAEGAEDRYVQYLSPEWLRMLRHTVREGRRLGLGVDMIQGTGWPFGGTWVPPADAAKRVTVTRLDLDMEGRPKPLPPRAGSPASVMAYPERGDPVDLTNRVRGNRIDWAAPSAGWSVYAMQVRPTGQKVKRAGPGADGPVVDPFGAGPSRRYFEHFTPHLSAIPPEERPRALFNDSFEAFGANWTAELLSEFERRRGYDLRKHLPALVGSPASDRDMRVRADYRQTVSELLLEDFTRPWTEWAHGLGMKTRNQAHGSPGNVLDLYAATDIPETEMFGPGRRGEGEHSGWRDIMVCKLASSAAHVAGKPLTSSESMTWLGEHFRVSLAEMKEQADTLFLSGVNHLFYHGTPFSPADAEWPGWLFYASTHVAPTNTWWRDLPALNEYIARCQSFLQWGRPDNDVLLYFPVHDLYAQDKGSQDLLQYIRVHNTDVWLDGNPQFAAAAKQLWEGGYGFDFVSDALLASALEARSGRLQGKGGSYRTILVAGCRRMPPATMERLLELARGGASVAIIGPLPDDVPGLAQAGARKKQLQELLAGAKLSSPRDGGTVVVKVGRGVVCIGEDLSEVLRRTGVRRETIAGRGLAFIRRTEGTQTTYFISNQTKEDVSFHPTELVKAGLPAVFMPITGKHYPRAFSAPGGRHRSPAATVRLKPGESVIMRLSASRANVERQFNAGGLPIEEHGHAVSLKEPWRIEFISGGPTLPRAAVVRELSSWTTWPDNPSLKAFSGTARYRTSFQSPERKAAGWVLDLGTVHHSAHVRLNGRSLGTLIAPPYQVEIPSELLQVKNELEVEVTNLMANRIAEMDRRKAPWKKFFFVNIDYKPFDASAWEPQSSGLLGPVHLIPLRKN